MAFRTTALMHIQSTTVPQPLMGSFITAGIGAPASVPITVTLGTICAGDSTVYDAEALFRVGDVVWLIDPDNTHGEPARISALPGGNQLTLGQQQGSPGGVNNPVTLNTHISGAFGTGTFIALHRSVNGIFVQMEDGTAGTWAYIGDSPLMTATYRRIVKLAKVSSAAQPQSWTATEYSAGNPLLTSELWILGGASNSNDGYTVACSEA